MKARASNLMIGSTTLAVIAVAFIGLLGYRKIHSIQQRGPLRIVFEGSASGLNKGGSVNFDGIQVGEIISLKLDNPRKVVAFTLVDNSAPIRKDTVVGLEFQGLTGVAAISLTGGAHAAPPVPLDEDGVPTLTADLSEVQSIRDTLHNVDRILVNNQATAQRCAAVLRNLYGDADRQGRCDRNRHAQGRQRLRRHRQRHDQGRRHHAGPCRRQRRDELFEKVKSLRELAETFNKRSGVVMEEGRRTLLDISQSAVKVTRKFDPQAVSGERPAPPRNPSQKRQ